MKTSGCIHDGWLVLSSKRDTVDQDYFFHLLGSDSVYAKFTKLAAGATVKNLNIDLVSGVEVNFPPVAEQRRIAAILDQGETLRTQRRAALALLDTLTQSIFLDMFGDPRTNLKNWPVYSVGEITDCIVPGRDKPKSFSGTTPWITTADLNHLESTFTSGKRMGLNDQEISEVRAKVVPSGSVIISCVGDLGIVSLAGVPMVINQQLHAFQCSANSNNIFLMHCIAFQKAFMLAKASSTTLPYMNKTVCNSIPVFVPPIKLQQTFATRIAAIEALKSTHRAALAQLDALFASLQHRAFSGELTRPGTAAVQTLPTAARSFNDMLQLDPEKGLEALIYVGRRTSKQDLYKALKTVYLADRHHLEHHGCFIYGETYNALPMGPVPQAAYEATKRLNQRVMFSPFDDDQLHAALRCTGDKLIALREADFSKLSEAERKSLDRAISYFADMSFEQVKTASHDSAYDKTPANAPIAMQDLIASLPQDARQRFFSAYV